MRADGLENVRVEPVMVPRWVRGHEQAAMLEPRYAMLEGAIAGRALYDGRLNPREALALPPLRVAVDDHVA